MSDARLSKATDPARANRAMNDRAVTEQLSKDDYKALLRRQTYSNALPDLPDVPGFHVCWLTTNSQYDTLARRQYYGYLPLTLEDVPSWTFNNVKGSAFEGWPIACNEMVAAKIPIDRYHAWMETYHHDLPNGEESKLVDRSRDLQEQSRREGADVILEEGQKAFGQQIRPPRHW